MPSLRFNSISPESDADIKVCVVALQGDLKFIKESLKYERW